jgi:hypothetical protein
MNNKIESCYVDFNTAKLLKEKGFDEITDTIFMINHSTEVVFENINGLKHSDGNNPFISRPEQWEVVEWLRINHGIEIEITKDRTAKWSNNYYNHSIFKNDILVHQRQLGGTKPNTPQEVYSAAFDYILTNLI